MTDKRKKLLQKIKNRPVELAHRLGFVKLTDLHNEWIKQMFLGKEDATLQAHRGSYKTTCVSLVLMMIIIFYPNKKTAFLRKTDQDVKEIIAQIYKMLQSPFINELVRLVWGVDLVITKYNATEINTNLTNDPRGTSQLVGMGINGSITGKHFDFIFTDDIVNVQDRVSKAEREHTKIIYQELQNIKNRDGKLFNTGTPWHEEDCFTLMPNIQRYDCYQTGLISKEKLEEIKSTMLPSLFSANYELRYIASEDVIFTNPTLNGDRATLLDCNFCHIDAAYGGSDSTAFTICQKRGDTYYVYGKLWNKHVDDCLDEIIKIRKEFRAGKIYCELNADKGYLAKELRKRGELAATYQERMNKFLKITTYLKGAWNDIVFVKGTDEKYLKQILDFTDKADHDDAPDSLSCLVRLQWNRVESYKSVFGG